MVAPSRRVTALRKECSAGCWSENRVSVNRPMFRRLVFRAGGGLDKILHERLRYQTQYNSLFKKWALRPAFFFLINPTL